MFTEQEKAEIAKEFSEMIDGEFFVAMNIMRDIFGHSKEVMQEISALWLKECDARMKAVGLTSTPLPITEAA